MNKKVQQKKLQEEIKEFISHLAQHDHKVSRIELRDVKALYMHSAKYRELIVTECDRSLTDVEEAAKKQMVTKIKAICEMYGLPLEFTGDPRGHAVRVFFDHHAHNSFIGRAGGWGIVTEFDEE